ncbi:hypothetical protein [Spirosoma areae]
MKKTIIYTLTAGFFALVGCRDESLNPVPTFEPAVHAYGVFDGFDATAETKKTNIATNAKTFGMADQDKAKLDFKIRWVSLDNKLTVTKVDIYLDMIESYNDPDGNPKTASLGNGGLLVKTISPSAANRQWNTFSITPMEIYNLYKDATVKYDKVNAVKVFANPDRMRTAGKWLQPAGKVKGLNVSADSFVITWRLTTSDGLVFKTWEPSSICADPTLYSDASANCSLITSVK